MIDTNSQIQPSNQLEKIYSKKKSNNVVFTTLVGMGVGSLAGEAAAYIKDEFVKNKKNINPNLDKETAEAIHEIVKGLRSHIWGTYGLFIGGACALVYSLKKNSQNKNAE